MAILESVKELASKLGAETNGRDITDQLNKINKHLDKTALSGRDIAKAVKTYSENASGGGGGFNTLGVSNFGWLFDTPTFNYSGQCILMHSNDGNYKITLFIRDSTTACVYLLDPANDINPMNIEGGKVIFTPGPNIRFINDAGEQLSVSGDEVTPSDGKIYILDIYIHQTTHKLVREVHKINEDFQIVKN